MDRAAINEIFVSIQGEGPWVGERHIFVRFQGCDLHCRYCDTPASRKTGSEGTATDSNLLTVSQLTARCAGYVIPGPSRPTISVTGGEPLLQAGFLGAWLPAMRGEYRIYLETNGIRARDMAALRNLVDVVSMDIKLPTAAGTRPLWQEHEQFLAATAGTELIVKAVVTAATSKDDLVQACRIIAASGRQVPFILQPASGPAAPSADQLFAFQSLALGMVADVRVIPQVHKLLNVP